MKNQQPPEQRFAPLPAVLVLADELLVECVRDAPEAVKFQLESPIRDHRTAQRGGSGIWP